MTKAGYKMTEIGEIPQEWGVVKLGDVLSLIKNGVTYKQNKKDSGYPVTRIETISEEKIDTAKIGYIDNIKTENINDYRLIKGDILFSHINSLEHIGKTAIYEGEPELLLHGMNLLLLRSDKSKMEPYYLVYSLKFYRAKELFKSMAKRAVNQASINQTELKRIKIPLPPLPEQQKIAEILSTADYEIQKVDEQITLTEQFKKGLMQRLLTRGIWHTKFKMTEIGEIPEEWSVMTIRDCSAPTGNINPASTFGKDEFYYVDVSGISSEKLAITETKRIRGIDSPSRARKLIKKDDVIFATIRPYLKRVAIVPENLDGNICSTAFCVIRANRNIILPSFLYYYAILDNFVNRVSGFQTGSAYPAVSDDQILSELIAIPKLHEQDKVSEILSTVDNKLELLGNKREKLDALKKGLMNDLLTGKVRVKV